MKLDNKGFSMVELLLTTALFSIVALAVTFFLTTGLRTCNATQSYINRQMESQIIMNQLSNFTLEGNQVEFKSDGANQATYHIYNIDKTTGETKKEVIISLESIEHKLYYYELYSGDTAQCATAKSEIGYIENGAFKPTLTIGQLLGENVQSFDVDIQGNTVTFELEVSDDDDPSTWYLSSEGVTMRNKMEEKKTSLID